MDPFIGQIIMFGGNFAPRGWALCDGQLLAISSHSALFSILGTTYGGDGRTTFGLPDLRGRVSLHPGNGPGLSSYRLGEKGGEEGVVLTESQMPSHKHEVQATNSFAENPGPGTKYLAGNDTGVNIYHTGPVNRIMGADMITNSGGGQSHENRQPYLGVNYIIALEGIFPSRN